MKKIISLLLAAMMCVSLCACGGNNTTNGGSNGGSNTYSCRMFEAGKTYTVSLWSSYAGIEYSYEMKWIAFDKIDVKKGKTEVTYKQEMI